MVWIELYAGQVWGDVSTQLLSSSSYHYRRGSAVNIVSDKKLSVITESFRDWGRDCWCPSGIITLVRRVTGGQSSSWVRP